MESRYGPKSERISTLWAGVSRKLATPAPARRFWSASKIDAPGAEAAVARASSVQDKEKGETDDEGDDEGDDDGQNENEDGDSETQHDADKCGDSSDEEFGGCPVPSPETSEVSRVH